VMKMPFVLQPDDLTSLVAEMARLVGPVKLSAMCTDDMEREFDSLDALLTYDNASSRAISRLRLGARSSDYDATASIRFDGSSTRNINWDVSADQATVYALSDLMESRVGILRPWYWRASRIGTAPVIWMLYMWATLVLPAWRHVRSGGSISLPSALPGMSLPFGLVCLAGVAAFLAITKWLDRLKASVFPMSAFAIGHGAKRWKDAEIIRIVVVVGFLISLAASIVATWLI
jgi:hypothetical protein